MDKEKTIHAYKGFDKDLKCRGFAYEIGKDYEQDGKIKCCNNGFHACEFPLEVFNYYAPGENSRYCTVTQSGEMDKSEGDYKVASSKIHIETEIGLGGTGYSLTKQLPPEIDMLQPDYSIYPEIDSKTAYGFLTRGCPNKCAWCVVPKKEGKIRPYMDVDDIAIDGRNRLILMDNNIVASDYGLGQIDKIISRRYRVDFNQALDARLITDDIAKMLVKVRWLDGYIRFGCDTPKQVEVCENVMQRLFSFGYTGGFLLYTMLHGSLEECYHRVSYWRTKYASKVRCQAQPMLDFTKQRQDIPQWQLDMARWCNKRQIYGSCDFKDYEPRKGFRCEKYF